MKMPVKWHLECLHNQINSIDKEIERYIKLGERINKNKMDIDYYQRQIDRAIKENKEGFDSEKYLDTRKEAEK
jgi:hypothetical protein